MRQYMYMLVWQVIRLMAYICMSVVPDLLRQGGDYYTGTSDSTYRCGVRDQEEYSYYGCKLAS